MSTATETIETLVKQEYKYGFVTDVESESTPPGLSEETIRHISAKRKEPAWLTDWRLKAFRHWQTMKEPTWQFVKYPKIDYQAISYFSAAQAERRRARKVWTKWIRNFWKPTRSSAFRCANANGWQAWRWTRSLIPCPSARRIAKIWQKKELSSARSAKRCRNIPNLSKNISARWCLTRTIITPTLNSAVFTDGSFCYIPKGVRCPMELSTYFRINAAKSGQFERTLIVADEGA